MTESVFIENSHRHVPRGSSGAVIQLPNVHGHVSRYLAAGSIVLLGFSSSSTLATNAFSEIPLASMSGPIDFPSVIVAQSAPVKSLDNAANVHNALSEIPLTSKRGPVYFHSVTATQIAQTNSPENAAKWRRIFSHLDFWSSAADETGLLAKQVLQICRDLHRSGVQAPRLTREDDGELDLVWDRENSYTSISLAHDGNFIAYHHTEGHDRPMRIDEPFSHEVYEAFREVARLV